LTEFNELAILNKYHPDLMLNMDETGICMDTSQNDALSEKGNKDILVGTTGRDKLRISAAITISISG
jgi:hypothetical protein